MQQLDVVVVLVFLVAQESQDHNLQQRLAGLPLSFPDDDRNQFVFKKVSLDRQKKTKHLRS